MALKRLTLAAAMASPARSIKVKPGTPNCSIVKRSSSRISSVVTINIVQAVQIVSAKQFGADPSFGGQAVQSPIH
jgi:hypothetical protein